MDDQTMYPDLNVSQLGAPSPAPSPVHEALAAVAPAPDHAHPNPAQHSFLQYLGGALGGVSKVAGAAGGDAVPQVAPQIQLSNANLQSYKPSFINLANVSR